MAATTSIYERCFVYSPTQRDELLKLSATGSVNKFKLGTVVVNGISKNYTEIVTNMSKCRYSDAMLVAKGDIRKMSFTEHSL